MLGGQLSSSSGATKIPLEESLYADFRKRIEVYGGTVERPYDMLTYLRKLDTASSAKLFRPAFTDRVVANGGFVKNPSGLLADIQALQALKAV